MKRLHVNLRVDSLEKSVDFYNALFKEEPSVQKPDYAKWMLEDPRVNFSISLSKNNPGIEHLGIQAENEGELADLYERLEVADSLVREEGDTVCCYAKSEKSWIKDPQDVEWEIFHTYGESDVNKIADSACCDDTCCSV